MNKLTSFILRLFIAISLLFVIVFLDHNGNVNYDDIKTIMSDNINVLKIIKYINGTSEHMNVIKIEGLDDEAVSSELIEKKEILGGYRYFPTEYQGVINETSGIVVSIKYNGYYTVTILDSFDNTYTYSNLTSFDHKIYEYIKAEEILGNCDRYYDLVIDKHEK